MTEPEPAKRPAWRPRSFELADPTAEPEPGWTPGAVERALRRMGRAARPWMAIPAVLVALAVAAVVPFPTAIERPGEVIDAATVVRVSAPSDSPGQRGHTGAYLSPRIEGSATALDWLLAAVLPGRGLVAPEPTRVSDLDPVESALLMGAGIAPGRANAAGLGLVATFTDPDAPRASLAVSLELFDTVSTQDLSNGRRVLALGSLAADGGITCAADPAATLRAAGPPVDVVLLGTDCPVEGLATLIDGDSIRPVPSLPDALVALSRN